MKTQNLIYQDFVNLRMALMKAGNKSPKEMHPVYIKNKELMDKDLSNIDKLQETMRGEVEIYKKFLQEKSELDKAHAETNEKGEVVFYKTPKENERFAHPKIIKDKQGYYEKKKALDEKYGPTIESLFGHSAQLKEALLQPVEVDFFKFEKIPFEKLPAITAKEVDALRPIIAKRAEVERL